MHLVDKDAHVCFQLLWVYAERGIAGSHGGSVLNGCAVSAPSPFAPPVHTGVCCSTALPTFVVFRVFLNNRRPAVPPVVRICVPG